MPFIILFILFPMAEIYVFIQVGHAIGLGTAFFIEILMAIFGVGIIQNQGMATLFSMRDRMNNKVLPPDDAFGGLCTVLAGVLFIIPGFITDVCGILLLIPPIQNFIKVKIAANSNFTYAEFHTTTHDQYRAQDPDVIDVEYEMIEKDDKS
jgi:UPF0716 protein FxsA